MLLGNALGWRIAPWEEGEGLYDILAERIYLKREENAVSTTFRAP
jgi:hypothetical protein